MSMYIIRRTVTSHTEWVAEQSSFVSILLLLAQGARQSGVRIEGAAFPVNGVI